LYLIEVLEHGGELPARRTPVGREVVEDQVLAIEGGLCCMAASISLNQLHTTQ